MNDIYIKLNKKFKKLGAYNWCLLADFPLLFRINR